MVARTERAHLPGFFGDVRVGIVTEEGCGAARQIEELAQRLDVDAFYEGIYWWYLNLENTSGQVIGSDPMDILNAPGAKEIAYCFAAYPR